MLPRLNILFALSLITKKKLTKMSINRTVLSMSRYNDTELDNKAQSILNLARQKKDLGNPTPSLDELDAAVKEYGDTLAAAQDGGRLSIMKKRDARRKLEELLAIFGAYVTMIAKGDKTVIASFGFDLRKEATPAPPVAAPQNIEVIIRNNPGEVQVKVDAVKNCRVYHFEYALDPLTDDSTWTAETDTRRKRLLKGLQSGKKYWFRVAASGLLDAKEYSNIVSCIVQ